MSSATVASAGYATFLVLFALGLDSLGRKTHARSGRYRTQGFNYRPDLDLWECPEGAHLRPYSVDHRHRIARYRAKPMICNACPAKEGCTDSDQGREVVRPLDPWPHSEAGRFHRGISLVVLGAAALAVAVGIFLTPALPDLVLLVGLLGGIVAIGTHMSRAFASMPSGFPGEQLEPHRAR